MTITGWDFTQKPPPPFAGANPDPQMNGSRTELVHTILEPFKEAKIVCVSISGERGMGKSALADFVSYIYSERRQRVRIGDAILQQVADLDSILSRVYKTLGGTEDPVDISWEHILNQISGSRKDFYIFRLRLCQPQIARKGLSALLCRFGKVFAGLEKKAMIVLERDTPVPSFSEAFRECASGQEVFFDLKWEYTEEGANGGCSFQVLERETSRRGSPPDPPTGPEVWQPIITIPFVSVDVPPLTYQEAKDFIGGREGTIKRSSLPDDWHSYSQPHSDSRCKSIGNNYDVILRWAGKHPATVHWASQRCAECAKRGRKCNKRELQRQTYHSIIESVKEAVRKQLETEPHKETLDKWGFLDSRSRIAGAISDTYRKTILRNSPFLFWNRLKGNGVSSPQLLSGEYGTRNELYRRLSELDDSAMDQCIALFPSVNKELGTDAHYGDKIDRLLNHCRCIPEEGERLYGVLTSGEVLTFGGQSVAGPCIDYFLRITRKGDCFAHCCMSDATDRISTVVSEEIESALQQVQASAADEAVLETVGKLLYDWIFPNQIKSHLLLHRQEAKLRIRLQIDAPSIAELPLELLYYEEGGHFFAIDPDTALVRYLEVSPPLGHDRLAPVQGTLDLLTITADPSGQDSVKFGKWKEIMQNVLEPIGNKIKLRTVRATHSAIRDALKEGKPHIVQFIGHGTYEKGKGYLKLIDERNGKTWKVDEKTFADRFLGGQDNLRLISLLACESATSEDPQGFRGVAPRLMQRGVPAVIGMYYPLHPESAKIFLEEFYIAVADRQPVDQAVQIARHGISQKVGRGQRDFACPVLYMRSWNGRIW